VTLAAGEPKVISDTGVVIGSQISWKEAHERLADFDVLVILGGDVDSVLKGKAEPLDLIAAYSELQKSDPSHERTLMSVCTGALFLAEKGILSGLSATTHPDFLTKFENICSQAAQRDLAERTDVIEDARYVVNNLRFELGDEDDNPYIRRQSEKGRRPSVGRQVTLSLS
jgi:transcriptional regulator GlxA family with amidase domain